MAETMVCVVADLLVDMKAVPTAGRTAAVTAGRKADVTAAV